MFVHSKRFFEKINIVSFLLVIPFLCILFGCGKNEETVSFAENNHVVDTYELKYAIDYPSPQFDGKKIVYISKNQETMFLNRFDFSDLSTQSIKLPYDGGSNYLAFSLDEYGNAYLAVSVYEEEKQDYLPHIVNVDDNGNILYDNIYDKGAGYFPIVKLFFDEGRLYISNGEKCSEIVSGEIVKESERSIEKAEIISSEYPMVDLDYPDFNIIDSWAFYDETSDSFYALMNKGRIMYAGIIREEEKSNQSKKELVIASYSPTSVLKQIISDYNRFQSDVHIILKEYKDIDIENAVSKLSTDMNNGEQIDLIDLVPGYDRDKLVSNGYYEDLSPFISKSMVISEQDYFPSVWNLGLSGDIQFAIPSVFSIQTMSTDVVTEFQFFTPESFINFADKLEDRKLLEDDEAISMLSVLLSFSFSEFVDEDTGNVYFDSDSFKNILLFCKKYGNTLHPKNEKPFFSELYIVGPEGFAEQVLSSESMRLTGYPSIPEGFGTSISGGSGMVAISSRSQMKEKAFSFIEYYTKSLSAKDHVMFSAEKERLIRQLDSEFEKINLNEEQKEYYTNMLLNTIENSVTSYGCDEKIGEIITEEAEAFFKDLSTLDETVERMTKRINLYFAEKH